MWPPSPSVQNKSTNTNLWNAKCKIKKSPRCNGTRVEEELSFAVPRVIQNVFLFLYFSLSVSLAFFLWPCINKPHLMFGGWKSAHSYPFCKRPSPFKFCFNPHMTSISILCIAEQSLWQFWHQNFLGGALRFLLGQKIMRSSSNLCGDWAITALLLDTQL